MASPKITIKVPPFLADAIDIRWVRLKYQSLSAYIIGLIRFDLMVQGDHPVSLPIAQSRPEDRDKVDEELLENTKANIAIRGAYIGGLLKDISKGKFATPEDVGAELVRIMVKTAKERKEGN